MKKCTWLPSIFANQLFAAAEYWEFFAIGIILVIGGILEIRHLLSPIRRVVLLCSRDGADWLRVEKPFNPSANFAARQPIRPDLLVMAGLTIGDRRLCHTPKIMNRELSAVLHVRTKCQAPGDPICTATSRHPPIDPQPFRRMPSR